MLKASTGNHHERHLISRELAEASVDKNERFSLMINEEDHLRIQVMQSGFNLSSVWEQINGIDDAIEQKVTYAFHQRLGYLTACPTNVGTGMRVSVMLHLPGCWSSRGRSKRFSACKINKPRCPRPVWRRLQAMGDLPNQQQ